MTRLVCAAVLAALAGGMVLSPAASPAAPAENRREELRKDLDLIRRYFERDMTDAKNFVPGEQTNAGFAIGRVVRQVGTLPEDDPLRTASVALARKNASVRQLLPQGNPGSTYHNQAHARLAFAWGVLRATKILHNGMSLEEVSALLGQPTKSTADMAEWYYASEMHVNPGLRYWKTRGGEAGVLEDMRR
jgi:hypothetical protein